jgi:8-oxo-dGTP diphosphatase
METPNVRVGIGVFVFKDGKFLLQKRQGAHGAGTWSLPGGHLEFGESFEHTARREVKEETDLEIKNLRFGAIMNDHFVGENEHYVSVWMLSEWDSGVLRNLEPEKCTAQSWHTFDDLPEPLFLTWSNFLESEFYESIKAEFESTNYQKTAANH